MSCRKKIKRKLKNSCGIQYLGKKKGEIDFGKYGKWLKAKNKGRRLKSITD